MKKLSLFLALLGAVALYLLLRPDTLQPPKLPAAPGIEPTEVDPEPRSAQGRKAGEVPLRKTVNPQGGPANPVGEGQAPLVTTYPVKVVVVDARNTPVAGAIVDVWPAKRVRIGASRGASSQGTASSPGGESWGYSGRIPGKGPQLTLTTDHEGRCRFSCEQEFCYLGAHMDGLGRAGDKGLSPSLAKVEIRLVIRPVSLITGVVHMPSGAPQAAAQVQAILLGGPVGMKLPSLLQTTTDNRGRFGFELVGRGTYIFRATVKSRKSNKVSHECDPYGPPKHIELQMPGAFAIHGVVLTPEGRSPAKGSVVAWQVGRRESTRRRAKVTNGRFELPLVAGGSYRIRGEGEGFADSPTTTVSLVQGLTRADVTLHLMVFGEISGVTLGPEGKPVSGVTLKAWRQVAGSKRISGPQALLATSSRTGSFRFVRTQPSHKYTVVCIPNVDRPRLELRRQDIAGNISGLKLWLTKDLLEGTRVEGRFVAAISGKAIPRFTILVRRHSRGAMSVRQPQSFTHAEGKFSITGLRIGDQYSLLARAEGHLPAYSRKFKAGPESGMIELGAPIPCQLTCRVHRRDGGQVKGIRINIVSKGRELQDRQVFRLVTDEDGEVEVAIPTGKYTAYIFPGDSGNRMVRSLDAQLGEPCLIDVDITKKD